MFRINYSRVQRYRFSLPVERGIIFTRLFFWCQKQIIKLGRPCAVSHRQVPRNNDLSYRNEFQVQPIFNFRSIFERDTNWMRFHPFLCTKTLWPGRSSRDGRKRCKSAWNKGDEWENSIHYANEFSIWLCANTLQFMLTQKPACLNFCFSGSFTMPCV